MTAGNRLQLRLVCFCGIVLTHALASAVDPQERGAVLRPLQTGCMRLPLSSYTSAFNARYQSGLENRREVESG
jgi:hypothetical protein